jgi:hypothetical protein
MFLGPYATMVQDETIIEPFRINDRVSASGHRHKLPSGLCGTESRPKAYKGKVQMRPHPLVR